MKYNTELFILKAREVHGSKYDYSKVEYIKAKEKVCIICPKHGEFWQRPLDHVRGHGCFKCRTEHLAEVLSISKELWLKLVIEKYNNKFDYSKVNYINYISPVTIICPIHGEFETTPINHYKSETGCSKCGREKANKSESLTLEEFIQKANLIHGNKYDYSKVVYINNYTPITIICPEHGEFLQKPLHHLVGLGCSKCHLQLQTRLYLKLKLSFPKLEILFEVSCTQVPWLEKQRFDIYIPSLNVAVEYNGKQHYVPIEYLGGKEAFENTLYRDELKHKKCKNNGCILYEIPYTYKESDYNELCNNIRNLMKTI